MSATSHRSAWADPEHVRLASYRSPDDMGTPAVRGPVPAFLDPWQGESSPAPLPGLPEQRGRGGYARHDAYAADRCGCGHIVYADERQPGAACRFCSCLHHVPPGSTS